jgi:hypothetical protein
LFLSRIPCFGLPLIKAASNQAFQGGENTCFYRTRLHFEKIDKVRLTSDEKLCQSRPVGVDTGNMPFRGRIL